MHGVGADGVGVKFPLLAVNFAVCPCPFGEEEKSEEKRRKAKKAEKCAKNRKMRKKKGENHSDPIYTNPIKNLPSLNRCRHFASSWMGVTQRGDADGADTQEDEYFAAYDDIAVHLLMLQDKSRVDAYAAAIRSHRARIEGKVVLDVGAGSGSQITICFA